MQVREEPPEYGGKKTNINLRVQRFYEKDVSYNSFIVSHLPQ
jgi:hypothetical protein